MKKFTISIAAILLFSVSIFAQNLIENPSFEAWTGTSPDSWVEDGGAITLSQNTTNVQEGASSCQVVFTSQDNQYLNANTFSVTAGDPIAVYMYAFDNDPAGRTRLCIIWEGADNYYGEYSEDMDSWQMISYEGLVPDGATEAKVQIRFYDVSDDWDGDCEIIIDNTSFILDTELKPEPSNYPTDFSAAANGAGAVASWTDATGDQVPQNYLVYASTNSAYVAPVDGTPVADDSDISDGDAVLNVAFGEEAASFSGLTAGTTYYFVIFPYTNSGADIDYKTDGTPPTAELVMPDVTILNFVDYEDGTFGGWTPVSVAGDQAWEVDPTHGNPGACGKMSGYDGAPFDNEDWLISPAFNFNNYSGEKFVFDNAMNYTGPALELYISSDYTSGDPNSATWDLIDFSQSTGSWEWVSSGEIDLSSYSGSIHLAFKFTSTTDGSATWELDNMLITGTLSSGIDEQENVEFSVYPNPSHGIYQIENSNSQNFEISVFNILGKQIMETVETNSIYTLDIQDFENGVYLLQIMSNNQKRTISIIKN